MKKIFLSAIAMSALILTGCEGNGNSDNQESAPSQQVKESQQLVTENSDHQKPVEDIAKLIWDNNFKSQYKDDCKNENLSITSDKSVENVIYSYYTAEAFEYDDGGMINEFMFHTLACYQKKDNSWLVIDCINEFNSDATNYYEYNIHFYNYVDGNLNSITENLFGNVTNKISILENDKKGFGGFIDNLQIEFNPNYIIVIDKNQATAMNWNGEKFDIAPATDAQYISEKDLFYKVADENKYLKGKNFDFSFDDKYLELNQFKSGNYNMSYGRFKLNNGGYFIYLRALPENSKDQTIYKYQFVDGKLSLISDNAFCNEVGVSAANGEVIFTVSNLSSCAMFYPYKDDDFDYDNVTYFYWDGEKFWKK